jgi:hypothetical protein
MFKSLVDHKHYDKRVKTPFLLQKWGLNSSPDHISTLGLKVINGMALVSVGLYSY